MGLHARATRKHTEHRAHNPSGAQHSHIHTGTEHSSESITGNSHWLYGYGAWCVPVRSILSVFDSPWCSIFCIYRVCCVSSTGRPLDVRRSVCVCMEVLFLFLSFVVNGVSHWKRNGAAQWENSPIAVRGMCVCVCLCVRERGTTTVELKPMDSQTQAQ